MLPTTTLKSCEDASEELHQNMEYIARELNQMLACVEDEYPDPSTCQSTSSSSNPNIPSEAQSRHPSELKELASVSTYMPAFSVLKQIPLINLRASETLSKQQASMFSSRKRWMRKHSSKQNSKHLYQNIVLDYGALGISGEMIKMNVVQQLLLAFNDCHNAMLEPVPAEPGSEESVFVATFCASRRSFLSPSQDISTHLANVMQMLNNFLQNISDVCSAWNNSNGVLSGEVYPQNWWHLYSTSRALYRFQELRFEHKHGHFLDSASEDLANHLVELLRSISTQIRVLRLHCVAMAWLQSVGVTRSESLNTRTGSCSSKCPGERVEIPSHIRQ